jgi:leucyl-tRNA synthetase
MTPKYDPHEIEAKWQRVWDDERAFNVPNPVPGTPTPENHWYQLEMLPYPSGPSLHMGHVLNYTMGDVQTHVRRRSGWHVVRPMGWDAFGLPAENAAIREGRHPRETINRNIETMRAQMKRLGWAIDWEREVAAHQPTFYRWTQWLFQQFVAHDLCYRREGPVNWCPNDQTVIANEYVVDGRCERCGAEVELRNMTQWYMRTTSYADELLEYPGGEWPEKTKAIQRNWIGRSEGAEIRFPVEGRDEPVTVFTTRPDTLYGATFFVIAADSPLAEEICAPEQRAALAEYLTQVRKLTDIERQSADRPKTGVFLGRHAVNPANGERIPVWAADYVLTDYGTGAIMGVPAHDQRDLDFARTHGLAVRVVVETGEPDPAVSGVATHGDGTLVNSGPIDGLDKVAAIAMITEILAEQGQGRAAVSYRLRDWLVSRQRFWGTPIPIVYCEGCGEVPVPDDQLPVVLPDLRGQDLAPKGVSPLAAAEDWVNTECPKCGGAARRDTDTMDTFVDSSWYFLRYCSPGYQHGPFDVEAVRRWSPVDLYVGGVEHAILHLMYSRFFVKVLHDMGMIDFSEPFTRLLNQGQVINQGRAMSKSLGNGVDLGEQLAAHGVDAIRLTMIFASPPEDDIDWADMNPDAQVKFLGRVWRLAADAGAADAGLGAGDGELRKVTHRTVDEVTRLVEAARLNVAVARLMELASATRRAIDSGPGAGDPAVREAAETLAILLSIFAPYTAEECWALLGHQPSVAQADWPAADPALLVEDLVTCVVQVNGKVRDRLQVPPGIGEDELRELALATPGAIRALDGAKVKMAIVRAPRLVNIVPA